tara:strand:- start:375 stop:515 length:141 start_codon:yes stop_codon:yes gene_type:complete
MKGGSATLQDCVTDCQDTVRHLVKHGGDFGVDQRQAFVLADSSSAG